MDTSIDIRKLQLYQLEAFKEVHRICAANGIKYFMIGGTLLGAVRHEGFIPWDIDLDIAMFRDDYINFEKCCKTQLNSRFFYQNYKTDKDFYPALSRICINNTYTEASSLLFNHLRHHKGIYIDIFPLDKVPVEKAKQNKDKKLLSLIDKIKYRKAGYVYSNGLFYWKRILKFLIRLLLYPITLNWLQKKREQIMTKYANEETNLVCSTASHYGYDKQVMERSIYGNPILLQFEDGMFFAPEKWDEYLTRLFGDYMTPPPFKEREALVNAYKKIIFDLDSDT